MRVGKIQRNTRETQISLSWDLDGEGVYKGSCGVGFFDHMMQALCVHGGFDIELAMKGDLEVDCHHSIEDLGIVLGMALKEALKDKGASGDTAASTYLWTKPLDFVPWMSAEEPFWSLTPALRILLWELWTAAWSKNFSGLWLSRRGLLFI